MGEPHKDNQAWNLRGFLWSPKFKSNGDRNYLYDTMAGVEFGDLVLRFPNGKISYFGIVIKDASTVKSQMSL